MNDLIKILGETTGEIFLRPALPYFPVTKDMPGVQSHEAKGPYGSLQLQEITGNEYLIRYYSCSLRQEDSLTFTCGKPALRLSLALKQSLHYNVEGLEKGVLHERGFNISYVPFVQQSLRLHRDRHYACVDFHFSADYLRQMAPYFPDVEIFLQKVEKQQPAFLSGINHVAGIDMLTVIDEILYCTYPAVIRKKYIGYKVMETLILALQKIAHPPQNRHISLPEMIVNKIYEASELLGRNMARNYTLDELSDLVELSKYNLKKGFKAIYGLTVSDYLHEARMQKARLLLTETDLPVSRIAAAIGYIHPFAFSSAFKKYFGFSPSLVQRSRKHTIAYI